ncbi:MAG: hypothetical protein RIS35_148 [Pseudomonadota bacterium]|jgi:putative FmdB family regulatory protein
MPIFAYRCDRCGFEKDVLQKRSDPPLTDCPACGEAAFSKKLTAPAFQLKGSGWYVTDFRDNGKKAPAGAESGAAAASTPAAPSASGASSGSSDAAAPAPASTPAAAPASTPASS